MFSTTTQQAWLSRNGAQWKANTAILSSSQSYYYFRLLFRIALSCNALNRERLIHFLHYRICRSFQPPEFFNVVIEITTTMLCKFQKFIFIDVYRWEKYFLVCNQFVCRWVLEKTFRFSSFSQTLPIVFSCLGGEGVFIMLWTQSFA